jgi:CheY-like chemotaxis protein
MTLNPPAILNARILIVDDQDADVQLLARMLSDEGYTNVTSTLQPEAVGTLHGENSYDLILLDLHMPGMDGFEVMEDLKRVRATATSPSLC